MFWKVKLMDKRKTKKKIWMLAMCLFVMCCLCSCKPSQKERYQTAVKLMEDGKYQKAYEQLKELGIIRMLLKKQRRVIVISSVKKWQLENLIRHYPCWKSQGIWI